jgi:hypothetical protein
MPRRGRVLQQSLLISLTLLVACVAGDSTADETTVPTDSEGTVTTAADGQPAVTTSGECEPAGDGVAWRDDATVELEQISAEGEVVVYAAEYPLPGPTDGLWSQWGQGIALGDGRHLSAVGDHLGEDANSYFFVYDSDQRSLTRFADVLSVVPHEEGAFGYGKVHAQMVMDGCGSIWAATYWGTRDELTYENGYEGDRLLEIQPGAQTISDRGAFAGEFGTPTMTMTLDGHTLVAASVDVDSSEPDRGVLTVYDTSTRETVTQVEDPLQEGFRALGIEPVDGGVFYAIGDSGLGALDPISGEFAQLDVTLPGFWLRSVTRPAPDGTVYGASDDEPALFSMSPDGELTDLGDPGGSTTSIAMTPDGSRIFWMPEAHGGAWEIGAVVNSMDTATGDIVELTSLLEPFEELGLLPGGTYSVVYDEGRLILGVNASPADDDSGFGTVVLVVIEGV